MEPMSLTVTPTSSGGGEISFAAVRPASSSPVSWTIGEESALLARYTGWADKEYRDAFVEAHTEEGVTFQIRANREARGWTQRDLAEKLGTHQSAVHRLEDPAAANIRLKTLQKLAHAFDCALLVKFVPYSTLASELQRQRPEDLVAVSYTEESSRGG